MKPCRGVCFAEIIIFIIVNGEAWKRVINATSSKKPVTTAIEFKKTWQRLCFFAFKRKKIARSVINKAKALGNFTRKRQPRKNPIKKRMAKIFIDICPFC